MKQNIYEFFGISNFSSMDEVKKSYRKMALIHHPDRGGNEEKMKIINEMYELISKNKNGYDNWLREQLNPQQSFTVVFSFNMNGSEWSYANSSTGSR